MGRLFGTDGIRGIAGEGLTAELALRLGRAAAAVLGHGEHAHFLIGGDTRQSTPMLCAAVAAGLCAAGADAEILGVVPTPAVAYLTQRAGADAGIVISASHNPAEFNGIKLFDGEGFKLPDALEERIEAMMLEEVAIPTDRVGTGVGRITDGSRGAAQYQNDLKERCPCSLQGLRIAVDCANGAASDLAEPLFSSLGAEVYCLHHAPNGRNINDACGSTHMESLAEAVTRRGLDLGIAFDGDADRCLAVDEQGHTVNGDHIMALCALDMKERGVLAQNTVVGTVMSNLGFVRFCEENGIRFVSTPVGDRYVLEKMLLDGYRFGGEQSGHIIFGDEATTGDGALTALHLLALCKRRGVPLSAMTAFEDYSQVMRGVPVSEEGKLAFYTDHAVRDAVEAAKEALGQEGRVVVRPSGTEPLIRIMTEGRNRAQIERVALTLEETVRARLGAL